MPGSGQARQIDRGHERRRTASDDGDKGLPVDVRSWDHQVRQAILLAAPYAVVASAPVEGFLHRTNELDTLVMTSPKRPAT
jgi:hypothetical protein